MLKLQEAGSKAQSQMVVMTPSHSCTCLTQTMGPSTISLSRMVVVTQSVLLYCCKDITIMGGELFKRVAVATKLWVWELKSADKTPWTYDLRTFTLHGRLDLDIEFHGHVLNAPVYVKIPPSPSKCLCTGTVHRKWHYSAGGTI